MGEWFVQLGYEGQLVTWLAASFLLYVLAAQLAWQLQWWFPGSKAIENDLTQSASHDHGWAHDDAHVHLVERVHDYVSLPWVRELIRLAYFLGIPLLAAVNGLLGADLLGISGTDWLDGRNIQGFLWEDWVRGLGLAAVTVLVGLGVLFSGRLLTRQAGLKPVMRDIPRPFWQRLLDALYDQIHWAFYRSGPILWLGDLYWGIFAGLALALLESVFNPALWWRLKSPETAGPSLLRLEIAWITALLFLMTQNLWLTLGVHVVLVAVLGGMSESTFSQKDDLVY